MFFSFQIGLTGTPRPTSVAKLLSKVASLRLSLLLLLPFSSPPDFQRVATLTTLLQHRLISNGRESFGNPAPQ